MYALKYSISCDTNNGEGFTQEEILESGDFGGADALMLISIIREGKKAHDGGVSIKIMSLDGQNDKNPIPDTELFHIWNSLCIRIIESPDTSFFQKQIAQETIDSVRAFVKVMKNE